MAKNEGTRRIIVAGKLIMLVGVTLGVIAALLLLGTSGVLVAGMIAFNVVALGGVVWIAGWIIKGFIEPDA